MPVIPGTVTPDVLNTGSDTWSTTATVDAGADLLLVMIPFRQGSVSSVTWDPTGANESLTRHDGLVNASGAAADCWYLVNPTAGSAKTLEIVMDTTNRYPAQCSYSLSNVDTSTPLGTAGKDSGVGTSASCAVAPASGDLTIMAIRTWNNDGTGDSFTGGTGQTARLDDENAVGRSYCGDEVAESAPSATWTTSTDFAALAVPVNEAGGGASALPLHRRRRAMMSLAGLTAPVIEALGHVFHRDSESGLMIPQGAVS